MTSPTSWSNPSRDTTARSARTPPPPQPLAQAEHPSTNAATSCAPRSFVGGHQVEAHVRRLAAPLLLRAGERVRSHREAPSSLRFSLRRASKGYGHRVSRQCPISGRISEAWGAVGEGVAAAAAAAAGGMPQAWKAAGAAAARRQPIRSPQGRDQRPRAPLTGKVAGEAAGRGSCTEDAGVSSSGSAGTGGSADVGFADALASTGPSAPSVPSSPSLPTTRRGLRHDAAGEALAEVVKLAMGMFDKICTPGERLDITLLSVGLAGFRELGGGSQTGMTRYATTSPGVPRARFPSRTPAVHTGPEQSLADSPPPSPPPPLRLRARSVLPPCRRGHHVRALVPSLLCWEDSPAPVAADDGRGILARVRDSRMLLRGGDMGQFWHRKRTVVMGWLVEGGGSTGA